MDLKSKIQQIENLPSPDFVLKKIMETASSPSASAKDLNAVASKDPGFVAKILKLANSAYYGLPKKVSKLTDAIMILGFKTVRNMAMSIFTNENFFAFEAKEIDIKEFWKHSISVATIGETVAERIGYSNKEEIFMCGLLHDLGKSVQALIFPNLFDSIVKVAKSSKISYFEAENIIGAPTHEYFARILLEKWKFPEIVLTSASNHHKTETIKNTLYSDPVFIITLSTFIAERMKQGSNGSETSIKLPELVWNDLGLTPKIFHDIVQMSEKKLSRIDDFVNIK